MSRNIFVISDTHFNHANILNFKDSNDLLIRPGFKDVQEMDQTIIDRWNAIVRPDDIIYHLGDVMFGHKDNLGRILPRLMGRKRLIMGNHDYDASDFMPYFDKIMSWRHFGKNEFKIPVIMTHFPLHTSSFQYKNNGTGINIHGHIHEKTIGDPSWINVSVERTNYSPVAIEDIVNGNYKG